MRDTERVVSSSTFDVLGMTNAFLARTGVGMRVPRDIAIMAMYTAICAGHKPASFEMLKEMKNDANPIVSTTNKSS